jgi:hypothetical protein
VDEISCKACMTVYFGINCVCFVGAFTCWKASVFGGIESILSSLKINYLTGRSST